jgi:hypothetical protein
MFQKISDCSGMDYLSISAVLHNLFETAIITTRPCIMFSGCYTGSDNVVSHGDHQRNAGCRVREVPTMPQSAKPGTCIISHQRHFPSHPLHLVRELLGLLKFGKGVIRDLVGHQIDGNGNPKAGQQDYCGEKFAACKRVNGFLFHRHIPTD